MRIRDFDEIIMINRFSIIFFEKNKEKGNKLESDSFPEILNAFANTESGVPTHTHTHTNHQEGSTILEMVSGSAVICVRNKLQQLCINRTRRNVSHKKHH